MICVASSDDDNALASLSTGVEFKSEQEHLLGVLRVNVGCGATPTPGWSNFDNSATLILAHVPLLTRTFAAIGLLRDHQLEFLAIARRANIRRSSAERLPFRSGSVDVIYSSHMLEHLDRAEASAALSEFHRILKPGGHLRLVLPDLRRLVDEYAEHRDADRLMESLYVCQAKPHNFIARLKALLVGPRHHHWMYDADSAGRLLGAHGFTNICSVPPGRTTIPIHGDLDLSERAEESFYIEARKQSNRR